jgi:hypothetical protein
MKLDPIPNCERQRIIRQVAAGQEWHGTRFGRRIRIRRQAQLPLTGETVSWSVCLHRRWRGGTAGTVTDAVNQVNAFIRRGGTGDDRSKSR